MAGEKTIVQNELVVAGVKPGICDPLLEQEKSTKKDATSTVKFLADQQLATGQAVYYPPTSYYYYYCPGYDGGYVQLNDNGYLTGTDASYTVVLVCIHFSIICLSDPYPTGTIMGVDGHQPYFSSAVLQNYVSYGSETLPYYSWNSTYGGDAANSSTTMHGRLKSSSESNTSANTKSFNNINKTNNTLGRPSNQSYSGYHSTGPAKSFRTVGKLSTYTSPNQGGYFRNDTSGKYKTIAKMRNSSERFNSKERSGELEHMTELIRGPRGCNQSIPLSSSGEDEQIGSSKRRGQYNLEDFQTDYVDAKFYVIKSYSEDDVYQCVKYNVWSSTLKGNKKLDAAYHDTFAKTSEVGKKCPIFMFYSVNRSGHFVGVAEMVGPVDFAKNMDFWRIGRWNGFFQVKWHIIKDIPNTEMRHITLENNDNKPVTFTRDTHEIGLKQGMEMLKIFKNYSAKTSLVDDFDFYENREKSHKAKMRTKKAPQTEAYKKHVHDHLKGGESILGGTDLNHNLSDSSSIVNLTKNLSLSSAKPLKSSVTLNCREGSTNL